MATPQNPQSTATKTPTPGLTMGGGLSSALVRGSRAGVPLRIRTAAATLDVGADVSDELDSSIPVFGNVLQSIGDGVASSQQALDQGVIDAVNQLNGTLIDVVTDVTQVLNDDGLPDPNTPPQLTKRHLSVLNFFSPTVHEWKNVSLSMDLSVGAFHSEQGLQFNQQQHSDSTTATGLFWGFLGWFDTDSSDSATSVQRTQTNDVTWQSGQIRVDAVLGPRQTGKFPVAASVTVGPQIYVTQGSVQEQKNGNVVTARTINMQIQVRTKSGAPNPTQPITINSGGLLPSFPGGTSTDASGNLAFTLTRTLVPGFTAPVSFQLTAQMGQLTKPFVVTL